MLKTEDGNGEMVGNRGWEVQNERNNSEVSLRKGEGWYGTAGPWQFMAMCYIFYTELENRVGAVVHACHPTTQEAEEGES